MTIGINNQSSIPNPRREYNQWVANETLEDFALRHTARRARRWSFTRISNTALGTSSFLVLELLGATICINYGVYHSLWAIFVVCSLLFLSGLPISYYATKYSVDIDLLTRGAGFGYIGSTISSLIYASFTFIFFALEAAVMASALELLFRIPLWIGYIISAVVVIPLVTHGISRIGKFQLITQPVWILLQIVPFIYVAQHPSGIINEWLEYQGNQPNESGEFSWIIFGSATAVIFSLMAQIGEQVDFLRFLPEQKKGQRIKWWAAVIAAGPGWVIVGSVKLILGAILAFLLIKQGSSLEDATNPTLMYSSAFGHYIPSETLSLIIAGVFVILCQIKINVANAYAGSLAWSNFFSRLTHHHPGRVVWVLFNVTIALMLMELGVYRAIETVLHHYSAFVLAWFGAIVADLIINKPLKLSPSHIEFKRSNLYDINPVGVGSMTAAAFFGVLASIGILGETAQALSGFIAFFLPFLTVPLIAVLTKSKYYLINDNIPYGRISDLKIIALDNQQKENHQCTVCLNYFDIEDMSMCPSHNGKICSLCCALETRCENSCRPNAHINAQLHDFFSPVFPKKIYNQFNGPLGQFAFLFITLAIITACIFYLPVLSLKEVETLSTKTLEHTLITIFVLLMVLVGVIVWLFVLAQKSTRLALLENSMQTKKLKNEVSAHKNTLQQLNIARKSADSANLAKSNYVTSLSHELRTPINVILGYAQLLKNDTKVSEKQKDSLSIMQRNGEHLATMIEGLLEISKIEAGKLNLTNEFVNLHSLLDQLAKMFKHQAASKGLYFNYEKESYLPQVIKVDEKRLRQILINLLSNAIKFTETGGITFAVKYRGHVARFIIQDTGFGIPKEKLDTIFSPFERLVEAEKQQIPGSGLGLAISRQLADMMGADIKVESRLGNGSTFTLLLQASPAHEKNIESDNTTLINGYKGDRKAILIVDDNNDHLTLLNDFLSPLEFNISLASNSQSCFEQLDSNIDLVLLDIRLGTESGWEVAKKIKAFKKTIPVLILSANARGFYTELPDHKIHDGYLEKPVQLDTLLKKIGYLLTLEWSHQETKLNSPSVKETTFNTNNQATSSNDTKQTSFLAIENKEYENILQELKKHAIIGNLTALLQELENNDFCSVIGKEDIKALHELAKHYNFGGILEYLENLEK